MPNLNYINKSGTQKSIPLGTIEYTTAPRRLNVYYNGTTYFVPLTPNDSKTVMYSDLNIYYDNKTYNPSYWQEITSFVDGKSSSVYTYGYNSYGNRYGQVYSYKPAVTIVNPNGNNINSYEFIPISQSMLGSNGSISGSGGIYNGSSSSNTRYVSYYTRSGGNSYDGRIKFTITYHGKTWTTSPSANNGLSAES